MNRTKQKELYYFKDHKPFLSEEVAKEASNYCDELLNSQDAVWSTNWAWARGDHKSIHNTKLERYNNLVLVHRIFESNEELYWKILNDIKKLYPSLEPETPTAMQYFVWTGGSNIEWHCDFKKDIDPAKRSGAITIYLNRKWDLEWGGDFLYKDENNEVQRVTPEYNRAVVIGQVDHRSTMIHGRRFRKCIQIFTRNTAKTIECEEDF